jgi:hypothetical protein
LRPTRPTRGIPATTWWRSIPCSIGPAVSRVKSRWATDYDGGFLIKNFDCDFVVHVALNRGYSYRCRREGGVEAPVFWVIPAGVADAAQYEPSTWGKVYLRHIPDHEQYREAWDLIREFLGLESV